MVKLTVKALPPRHWGRQLVQLNIAHRDTAKRYEILKISHNGKQELCLCLGHDSKDEIFMDYDVRKALCIKTGSQFEFSIQKVSLLGKLKWYFSARDPAVYIPAWIAAFSGVLGIVGIIISLCCKGP